jgi:hypothetical protein
LQADVLCLQRSSLTGREKMPREFPVMLRVVVVAVPLSHVNRRQRRPTNALIVSVFGKGRTLLLRGRRAARHIRATANISGAAATVLVACVASNVDRRFPTSGDAEIDVDHRHA